MKHYDIAAYIWPAYTGDDTRSLIFWPDGIGEWQSVKKATARYEGHNWPRKPLWGYCDEANPEVMEMQIDAAANHGVNVFIYDWYWYDNRPFLENCLNDGYLKAKNNDRVKFYLMWANHDANYTWDRRLSDTSPDTVVWKAVTNRQQFETVAKRVISQYFSHPSYYRIDDCPVFEIYELRNLVQGLGGTGQCIEALNWFREETKKAGHPGLHLQLCSWGSHRKNMSGVDGATETTVSEELDQLGFDSTTHYQYCHFTNVDRDYAEIMKDVEKEWERMDTEFNVPYFPHVSIGWDNNPRFQNFRHGIVKNNDPAAIEKAFLAARDYVDNHPDQAPLITVNSWNEWTETSYLQPDDLYGYGYLEAIKRVFKDS
ncbi:MAG: glycoside hydrolase family 99-like domain-containing protein [Lentisphaeria bacterium]|nr:glycoside hydrolase family 99-like domain-containing protein [Lentisphaeria bacterium]NQZ71274.1 glycoside hydrolase family 99-like domain-containing protein [Lentisphaeria bacterium]